MEQSELIQVQARALRRRRGVRLKENECPQNLWQQVLAQAVLDAVSGSRKGRSRKTREEAIAWLMGDSEDFHDICTRAGTTPQWVRSTFVPRLQLH